MNGSTSAKACRYFACKSTGINFTKRLIRFELSQPASTSSGGLVAGLLSKHNFRLSTVSKTVLNRVVASGDHGSFICAEKLPAGRGCYAK